MITNMTDVVIDEPSVGNELKTPEVNAGNQDRFTVESLIKHFGGNPYKKPELEAIANRMNTDMAALDELREIQREMEANQKAEEQTKKMKEDEVITKQVRGRLLLKSIDPASYALAFGLDAFNQPSGLPEDENK